MYHWSYPLEVLVSSDMTTSGQYLFSCYRFRPVPQCVYPKQAASVPLSIPISDLLAYAHSTQVQFRTFPIKSILHCVWALEVGFSYGESISHQYLIAYSQLWSLYRVWYLLGIVSYFISTSGQYPIAYTHYSAISLGHLLTTHYRSVIVYIYITSLAHFSFYFRSVLTPTYCIRVKLSKHILISCQCLMTTVICMNLHILYSCRMESWATDSVILDIWFNFRVSYSVLSFLWDRLQNPWGEMFRWETGSQPRLLPEGQTCNSRELQFPFMSAHS